MAGDRFCSPYTMRANKELHGFAKKRKKLAVGKSLDGWRAGGPRGPPVRLGPLVMRLTLAFSLEYLFANPIARFLLPLSHRRAPRTNRLFVGCFY